MVKGIRLALEQAGSRAGNFTIEYISRDASTQKAGGWTREAVSRNAREAARDQRTAVYIGELDSGASAAAIPILSEGMVAQISPSNTAVGLTSDEPGADRGEPGKYYPGGFRNYVRIVPNDTVQGAALATLMKRDGCTRVVVVNGGERYGAGLARIIEKSAVEQKLGILFNARIDPRASNYRSLASRARSEGADCFVFGGVNAGNGVQIFRDVGAALPRAKLYGSDEIAEAGFTDPMEGGIPTNIAGRLKLTVAALDRASYPPQGRQFFEEFAARYGEMTPDPHAIYGYEAMRLALDAIERSVSGKREDIVRALFDTKDRRSVLGTYSLDENGDTTMPDYGVYTIKGDDLSFLETIRLGS